MTEQALSAQRTRPEAPVFVPIALEMDQALVTLGALRAIFESATLAGEARNPNTALLAQAMYRVAEAIDARRTALEGGSDA